MPALAMRFTGGRAVRLRRDAHAATGVRHVLSAADAEEARQARDTGEDDRRAGDPVSVRLAAEFRAVPYRVVRRCVADAGARAAHLGVAPAPEVVERLARERLLAVVNSAPPSRAAAFRL